MFCASSIGRERGEGHRLGFAALENGGAMRAREDADFAGDLAQIVVAAAVDALLLVEDAAAERLLLDVIERLVDREFVRVRELLEDGGFHFFAQTVDGFAAGDFAFGVERGFDPVARDAVGDFENLRLHFHQRHLALRLADLRGEFFLDADHFACAWPWANSSALTNSSSGSSSAAPSIMMMSFSVPT